MASLGMCCRHVYKTSSEDDSQSRTDLLLCTSLHLSCTLSTTQCASSSTPTHSCTIIYFSVQVTVLLHIGIAANSTTASISGPAVSVARSQHQILMTSLHVSSPPPPLKKINPKCHAHRLPVSIFEIGNRNFVGFICCAGLMLP